MGSAKRKLAMAYDEHLAERIRAIIGDQPGLREQKMFGGIGFMLYGHMAAGIIGSDLMVRVGPEAYDDALAQPHARLMDITGRPMRGFVIVDAAGIATRGKLRTWLARGLGFASTLPPK